MRFVHPELVDQVAEGVEVRIVLRWMWLDVDRRFEHLLPWPWTRHETGHRVAVGHRCPVAVRRPVLDPVALHIGIDLGIGDEIGHEASASVGRIRIGDTGDENQRSITRVPASSITPRTAGSSSGNGRLNVARAR